MKRTWIAYVATGVLAAGAAVFIAGWPTSTEVADDIVTEAPATTTSTTVVPATTAVPAPSTLLSTTTLPATTTTAVPILDQAELSVGVVNATDRAGVAGAIATVLADIGYTNVRTLDSSPQALSTVFYDEGLEPEAARLAVDAGLDSGAIGPMSDAPTVNADQQFQLLVVVGLDWL